MAHADPERQALRELASFARELPWGAGEVDASAPVYVVAPRMGEVSRDVIADVLMRRLRVLAFVSQRGARAADFFDSARAEIYAAGLSGLGDDASAAFRDALGHFLLRMACASACGADREAGLAWLARAEASLLFVRLSPRPCAGDVVDIVNSAWRTGRAREVAVERRDAKYYEAVYKAGAGAPVDVGLFATGVGIPWETCTHLVEKRRVVLRGGVAVVPWYLLRDLVRSVAASVFSHGVRRARGGVARMKGVEAEVVKMAALMLSHTIEKGKVSVKQGVGAGLNVWDLHGGQLVARLGLPPCIAKEVEVLTSSGVMHNNARWRVVYFMVQAGASPSAIVAFFKRTLRGTKSPATYAREIEGTATAARRRELSVPGCAKMADRLAGGLCPFSDARVGAQVVCSALLRRNRPAVPAGYVITSPMDFYAVASTYKA